MVQFSGMFGHVYLHFLITIYYKFHIDLSVMYKTVQHIKAVYEAFSRLTSLYEVIHNTKDPSVTKSLK
jgi:hypothetical protein